MPRPLLRLTAAAVTLALAGVASSSGAAGDGAPPLVVSGVPKVVGRGQAFVLNASGAVPANFVGPGAGGASVLVTAVEEEHVPDHSCAADDGDYRGTVLLARNVAKEHFSFTRRVRIRSDLDYSDGQRHPYRVCVLVFPNRLRKGQDETQASTVNDDAAHPRLVEHHVAGLPTPLTGRITASDGSGVGGVRVRAGAGSAYTGDDGRYTLLVRRGPGTVAPSSPGATFTPASRPYRAPTGRAANFTVAAGR